MTAQDGTGPVELRAWLTGRVAQYLQLPTDEVDTGKPLADYGLDSVYALAICGDIEDHLDVRLDATIVWDHPTVDKLVHYLTEFLDQQAAGTR